MLCSALTFYLSIWYAVDDIIIVPFKFRARRYWLRCEQSQSRKTKIMGVDENVLQKHVRIAGVLKNDARKLYVILLSSDICAKNENSQSIVMIARQTILYIYIYSSEMMAEGGGK